MRTYTVVGSTVCFVFRLLIRGFITECHRELFEKYRWNCSPSGSRLDAPDEVGVCLIAFPLIFSTLYRELDVRLYLCLWALSIGALFYAAYLGDNKIYYTVAGVYCLPSLISIFEKYRYNNCMAFIMMELQKTMKEKEEMADEMHATEMRHMIANVAHDLKTPLTSFLSGIELISAITLECQQNLRDGDAKAIQDNIVSVLNCIQNIRNTNSFMLMTINRCIDYTKASKGLKLVPKHETIDLLESLLLPLNCMKDIQQRVLIVLDPLPQEICSHIITDKQWLQENVLCLLSNAVKYSSGGEVRVMLKVLEEEKAATVATVGDSKKGDVGVKEYGTAGENDDSKRLVFPRESPLCESNRIRASTSQIFPTMVSEEFAADMARRKDVFENIDGAACKRDRFLRIEFEDNGIGLSEEAMANLFNPFKQAQRLAGGTGLGLYSLARRVEALNGLYGVSHRRDGKQGSMFWFSIPYRADEVTAGGMGRKPFFPRGNHMTDQFPSNSEVYDKDERLEVGSGNDSEGIGVGSDGPSRVLQLERFVSPASTQRLYTVKADERAHLNILIADDSPAIVKMISMMLRRLGHHITIAENGDVALKVLWERLASGGSLFDVVLMDLQMPVMDGLEATRRLRAFEKSMRSSVLSEESNNGSGSVLEESSMMNEHADASYPCSLVTPDGRRIARELVIAGQLHQLVIGVSANSDHETMQDALNAGVDAFISKPFSIEMFYATYEKLREDHNSNMR
eukprot:scaffold634_cov185-Ochromonas_danica.AAC.8